MLVHVPGRNMLLINTRYITPSILYLFAHLFNPPCYHWGYCLSYHPSWPTLETQLAPLAGPSSGGELDALPTTSRDGLTKWIVLNHTFQEAKFTKPCRFPNIKYWHDCNCSFVFINEEYQDLKNCWFWNLGSCVKYCFKSTFLQIDPIRRCNISCHNCSDLVNFMSAFPTGHIQCYKVFAS